MQVPFEGPDAFTSLDDMPEPLPESVQRPSTHVRGTFWHYRLLYRDGRTGSVPVYVFDHEQVGPDALPTFAPPQPAR